MNRRAVPSVLPVSLFATVVELAPLVSIDLIVRDAARHLLVGLRRNRPAQGCWFVPGGRILKDESLDDAFLRITEAELGQPHPRSSARFLGVYEHFYDDNFTQAPVSGLTTRSWVTKCGWRGRV